MKRILITGKNSYIGNSLERWLSKWPDKYAVEKISLRNPDWKEKDFSSFDVIFHVAGIAHVPTDHTDDKQYYSINRDLAIEIALKAKKDGVKQFIFMSSCILYGIDEPVGVKVIIDENTVPNPKNAYGISKLQADIEIQKMNTDFFKTVCVRTCMVYGAGCKGNFITLRDKISKLPILPYIDNCRSMIHIDNLSNHIKLLIDNESCGVTFPQNSEYVRTNDIVKLVREYKGKKTYESRIAGFIVRCMSSKVAICRKAYGDLAVNRDLSDKTYIVNDFKKTIEKSMAGGC
jgi:UDP-glucose 4-epimerase